MLVLAEHFNAVLQVFSVDQELKFLAVLVVSLHSRVDTLRAVLNRKVDSNLVGNQFYLYVTLGNLFAREMIREIFLASVANRCA